MSDVMDVRVEDRELITWAALPSFFRRFSPHGGKRGPVPWRADCLTT